MSTIIYFQVIHRLPTCVHPMSVGLLSFVTWLGQPHGCAISFEKIWEGTAEVPKAYPDAKKAAFSRNGQKRSAINLLIGFFLLDFEGKKLSKVLENRIERITD